MSWWSNLNFWREEPAPPPPPPSRGTLDPDLLRKIRGIQIRAQRQVSDLMAGEYASAFKGRGMEFEEVREYTPGDDVRSIDWNVTARLGHPFVKVFREERELTVMIVVDVSSSGEFGTRGKQKLDLAAELAAVLAYTAIRSNDKVGLLLFSDRIEQFIPPRKGRAHVWRVIREVLTSKEALGSRPRRTTNVRGALEYLALVLRRKSICFLISDFQDEGWEQPLRVASGRHDLITLGLSDRHEVALPAVGYLTLQDAETGETLIVDTSDTTFLHNFHKRVVEDERKRQDTLRAMGVDHISIRTDEDLVGPLLRYFHTREVRR